MTLSPMLFRRRHDNRLNLSSNELLHPDAAPMLKNGLATLPVDRIFGYPDFKSSADHISEQLGIQSSQMLMVPGTDAAIRLIVSEFASCAKRMVLQYPNYYAWEQAAAASGTTLKKVPWNATEGPCGALFEKLQDQPPSLVALSFPNGPVGCRSTISEIDELVDAAHRLGHLVVVDACYSAFHSEQPSVLNRWIGKAVVLQSFSKSHGLAAFRIGILSGESEVIDRIAKSRIEHCVSAPAMHMLRLVLDNQVKMEKIWSDIRSAREEMAKRLRDLGLQVIGSEANFMSFHAGSKTLQASIEKGMLEQGVRIKAIGEPEDFDDLLRMTVGHSELMQVPLKKLASVLNAVPKMT